MLNSFIERENEIIGIIDAINKSGMKYVLVGGYAVSAYMRRFSVDADICIDLADLDSFRNLLKSKNFKLTKRRDLEDIYKGEFESYAKKTKLPVSVDLMIGSVASRQTNASISFKTLYENSIIKKIIGIEKETEARIPIKELLIAMKIHAARLTDARDIAALSENIDFKSVGKFMNSGNQEEIKINIKNLLAHFKSENFKDSFKGVFSIEKLPLGNIQNAIKLMEGLGESFI
ncbi:MAG: hypothetical protein AABX51_04255 [Nanoarchaeota archaeon]